MDLCFRTLWNLLTTESQRSQRKGSNGLMPQNALKQPGDRPEARLPRSCHLQPVNGKGTPEMAEPISPDLVPSARVYQDSFPDSKGRAVRQDLVNVLGEHR